MDRITIYLHYHTNIRLVYLCLILFFSGTKDKKSTQESWLIRMQVTTKASFPPSSMVWYAFFGISIVKGSELYPLTGNHTVAHLSHLRWAKHTAVC